MLVRGRSQLQIKKMSLQGWVIINPLFFLNLNPAPIPCSILVRELGSGGKKPSHNAVRRRRCWILLLLSSSSCSVQKVCQVRSGGVLHWVPNPLCCSAPNILGVLFGCGYYVCTVYYLQ